MSNFVATNYGQDFLLPPSIKDWLPENDMAHFVLGAVERVSMSSFKVNEKGSGAAQYHPRMMLALLVYCYANGTFSSRRIEQATHRDIGVRYVAGDCHPDHDTICKFRRENAVAVKDCFLQVLLLAKELKLLKVGRVSVDGTKIKANASKRRSIRYDRAKELRSQLQGEIDRMLSQAEKADEQGERDEGQRLPEALSRSKALKAKLDAAKANLERRAEERAEAKRPEYERKDKIRRERGGSGRQCKPPSSEPRDSDQSNTTDPDSRLMRKNSRSEFQQCYNAQAAVDAGGSMLLLGARVSQSPNDYKELVKNVDAIDSALGKPSQVLADNGYASGSQVKALEVRGIDVLVAVGSSGGRRRHDFRPEPTEPKMEKKGREQWVRDMKDKMERDENRDAYKLRQQTVEPVFGVMKQVMGFRQFLLRGKEKVGGEWQLLSLAYNCKKLHKMMEAQGA